MRINQQNKICFCVLIQTFFYLNDAFGQLLGLGFFLHALVVPTGSDVPDRLRFRP